MKSALRYGSFIVCLALSLNAQAAKRFNSSGNWIATFGDSAASGTLILHIDQDSGGHVTGNYESSLGGKGLVTGQVNGDSFSFTLAQTQSKCPGTYHGSVIFDGNHGSGSFSGKDCLGVHKDGVVSLSRGSAKTASTLPPIRRNKNGDIEAFKLIYENGEAFWLSRSKSAFLAVGAREIGGYFRLTMLVDDSGATPFTFFPKSIQVIDGIRRKPLHYVSPKKIEKRIDRRAAFAAALSAFGNGLQAYSNSMTTVHTTGTVSAYDNYGNWTEGSYTSTSTVHQPVDQGELDARNRENETIIHQRAKRKIASLNAGAIGSQTLAPRSYIVGNLMFSRPLVRNMKSIVGRRFKSYYVEVFVPVNGEKFLFIFPVRLIQALPHK